MKRSELVQGKIYTYNNFADEYVYIGVDDRNRLVFKKKKEHTYFDYTWTEGFDDNLWKEKVASLDGWTNLYPDGRFGSVWPSKEEAEKYRHSKEAVLIHIRYKNGKAEIIDD